MNYLALLKLIPYVLAGIQTIHADAPGATKKQLAMEALGMAEGAAGEIVPGAKEGIDAASKAVSTIIDESVKVLHATNNFGFGKSKAAPSVASGSQPIAAVPDPSKPTV